MLVAGVLRNLHYIDNETFIAVVSVLAPAGLVTLRGAVSRK